MQKQQFYSNGKLLISGEYLVLKGATALAVPVKLGQGLHIEEKRSNKEILYWRSYENDLLWFEIILSLPEFELIETSDRLIGDKLINILKSAYKRNPGFIKKKLSYIVNTQLSFNKDWGLGSSSSLINNIANWSQTNPYDLLGESFGGSGYDIACASSNQAIFFSLKENKPIVEKANFSPDFHQQLYFVYLGKKQFSSDSISEFEKQNFDDPNLLHEISEISKQMVSCKNLKKFQELIVDHETILSGILKRKKIKEEYFSDFHGAIKSLGGWGGDFMMVASALNSNEVKSYFDSKGLKIIFNYEDIIKNEAK